MHRSEKSYMPLYFENGNLCYSFTLQDFIMTKIWHALFIFLISFPLFAEDKGPAVPDYPVDKVAENTYVIHGPLTTPNPENQGFMNNPAIILTTVGVVLVDPGGTLQTGEMVLRAVKKLTDMPIVTVFNTHVHGDHWLGNQAVKQAYPDAVIYAHPNMIEEVAAGAGDTWLNLMMSSTDGKSAGTIVVSADKEIDNGQNVVVGDTHFTIYNYGTAHTDSDIMIMVNRNEVLFTGDNLFNGRFGRSSEGTIKGVIDSCEKIMQLKPVVIVPGHGQTGDMVMFNHALDAFRILYKIVEEQFEDDVSDFEMKPLVVKALSDYKEWEEFDNLLGKAISQAYLEIEEANF